MEYFVTTLICILWVQMCVHAALGANRLDVTLSTEKQSSMLHLGYKRTITMKVKFPVGAIQNTFVIVRPSTTKLVMALGLATVTKRGSNIRPFSTIFYYSVLSSTRSTGFNVIISCTLHLGDISNSGSSSVEDNNSVTILVEVYVQSVDFVTNEEEHSVVFEVHSGNRRLWSGNVNYYIRTAIQEPIKTPEVHTSFPPSSTLERGNMTRIIVDLWMPLANPDIAVTARSHSDYGLRVLRLSVKEVGENYRLPIVLNRYIVDDAKCDEIIGNTTLHLVFPTHFANKDLTTGNPVTLFRLRAHGGCDRSAEDAYSSMAPDPIFAFFGDAYVDVPVSSNDSIKLEVAVYMDKDVDLGTVHPVEVTIDVDSSVLWNSTFDLISSDFGKPPILSQLKTLPYNSSVTIGQDSTADVNLTTPEFGVYEINVILTSLNSGGQGEAGLAMNNMVIVTTATNVLCSTLSVSYSKTDKSRVQNVAEVVLNVTNFGSTRPSPEEDKNWLVLRIYFVPVPRYAEIGDVRSVEINSSSLSVTYLFSVNGATTFDQDLVYTVEIYHFESATCIVENGTFELFVNITTTRYKSPGPMYIVFPDGNTVFAIKKYNIVRVGDNLLSCFQAMQMDGSLDQSIVYDDGSYGNVTLDFPLICNKDITGDTEADILTIRVVVSLRPDLQLPEVVAEDFTVVVSSPGLKQDALSSLFLTIAKTTHFPTLSVVSGVAITQMNLDIAQFALNCYVQYSENNTGYQNATLTYASQNKTHVVFGFGSGLLGTSFRIAETMTGNVSCCVLHKFLMQNLAESLKVFGDSSGSLLSNLTSVFDKKNTTCFQVPVQGDTVPILWIRLNLLKLWSLTASDFRLTVFGHGITCQKENRDFILKVYYASSPTTGDFHGDVTYCLLEYESMDPYSLLARCSYQCPCVGTLCLDAFVFMTSNNKSGNKTLCEITAGNI